MEPGHDITSQAAGAESRAGGSSRPAPWLPWVGPARSGDMAAFRSLYEATYPGLFNVLARLADSPDDARETAQLAFVKAWQNLSELRDDGAFSGWLRRIAVNLLRDRWRREERLEEFPDDDAPGALPDPSPDPSETFDRIQRNTSLEEAIRKLPEVFRLPIVLHYLDDRPVEEVAGILDIPRGTVLSRLARARDRLKRHFHFRNRSAP